MIREQTLETKHSPLISGERLPLVEERVLEQGVAPLGDGKIRIAGLVVQQWSKVHRRRISLSRRAKHGRRPVFRIKRISG
jgi:hypothetical protein